MTPYPLVLTNPEDAITAEAEGALIWSFRQWVSGHVRGRACHWQLAWQRLADVLGREDGTRAVVAIEALVRTLCRHARRPLNYHQPHCPCLGADERTVIGIIAECQRASWLNAARAAEGLVEPDGTGELIDAAARLARLFAEHGQHLPLDHERAPAPVARDSGAPVQVLH